jgi:hypothetical protein
VQLCSVLQFMHDRGFVHRNLKPSNLLVLRSRDPNPGLIKVLDFGIGQFLCVARSRAPGTEASWDIPGTVPYASPEQLLAPAPRLDEDDGVDFRTDLYSLGVILYELLAGHRPFDGPAGLLYERFTRAPRPLTANSRGVSVPSKVERIIMRCLAMKPTDRPQSAKEIGDAFEHALSDRYLKPEGFLFRLEQLQSIMAGSARLDETLVSIANSARPRLEEIQFTVFRPKTIRPDEWYPLLTFTHLADRRRDAPESEPDPIEQVRAQAEKILGERARKEFRESTADAHQAIPRQGEILLVPHVPGITFNPDRRVFRWMKDVHREEFDLRATAELDGTTARGSLSAYLGAILLAEIPLAIKVDSRCETQSPGLSDPDIARPFRKIFASYSHKDAEIVRQFERFVITLGDRYLRDVRDLRAGENWTDAVRRLIDEADVFQLFWSTSSMRSSHVRQEWEYALALHRPAFVRPTYWEEPLPESEDGSLPPEELRRLHFQKLAVGPATVLDAAAYMNPEAAREIDELSEVYIGAECRDMRVPARPPKAPASERRELDRPTRQGRGEKLGRTQADWQVPVNAARRSGGRGRRMLGAAVGLLGTLCAIVFWINLSSTVTDFP